MFANDSPSTRPATRFTRMLGIIEAKYGQDRCPSLFFIIIRDEGYLDAMYRWALVHGNDSGRVPRLR